MSHKLDHRPFLVPPGQEIQLSDYDPRYCAGLKNKKEGKAALLEDISDLAEAQSLLWANQDRAVLIIFQALDAAGKDGSIKHVMSGVNPQGVDVHAFKAPSDEERLHHFLWRPQRVLPARGRIAIFNRSYYEEVLVVRVHPKYLESQFLPSRVRDEPLADLWQSRYRDINEFERVATENDICVIKFFLNVSMDEQRERFIERLENPAKNWKFSAADLRERERWDDYQVAFEDALNATSTEAAPWYVIPADRKWYRNLVVARIMVDTLKKLNMEFPPIDWDPSAMVVGD
mgnify:CR=1 FL=1